MWKKPILPQYDTNSEDRKEDIEDGQHHYYYKHDYKSLEGVAMVKGVPFSEFPDLVWSGKFIGVALKLAKNIAKNSFDEDNEELKDESSLLGEFSALKDSFDDFDEDNTEALDILLNKFATKKTVKRARSLEDYDEFFESLDIPSISKNFQDDETFVRMRVAGQNPIMLNLVKDIKKEFPLTNEIFQSIKGFEEDTLENTQKEERFYIADYKALENVENGKNDAGDKYSYAPKAIFALDKNEGDVTKALKVIAIICEQEVSEDTPIFTPNDKYAWNIAKTIVQIADFNYHELVTHLGATHLVIEPFVVSTHRQLADRHPVKMLLLPHFEGTIFINWGAQASLVNDGGPFDKLFSGTMKTNREVVANRLGQSFNKSMLLNDLKERGVEDNKLYYPYRDDAKKLWNATFEWVGNYLSTYYSNDKDVENDVELQAWVSELMDEGRVKGFGEDDNGKMSTISYLQEVITMIIFTASSQHSAVNFSQKDFSGYTPNMPSAGYTPAPKDKNKTEQDWFDLLPPTNMSESQINLAQLLSGVSYTTLGDYGWFYFWDMRLVLPMIQFKLKLKKIEKEIIKRNNTSDIIKYDYLLPSKIPQSINI